ncbi:hypothetical protein L198_07248 [Cryptococcus wingfieldii CBS 7118]|uniref:Uncharacterized protein n=1 Tax=Cryptococcus wingfieldii CBS 7118 TaxID=1295528 RepID=A0A1E3ID79_9TREE|nr:hypothetical protein L198_07248 [Cryptococcus wingfieldii CBS 7118]ODN86554.1 hypothetical protein L198_07248 [Cryptococcus wingfieldii CBS 7118]
MVASVSNTWSQGQGTAFIQAINSSGRPDVKLFQSIVNTIDSENPLTILSWVAHDSHHKPRDLFSPLVTSPTTATPLLPCSFTPPRRHTSISLPPPFGLGVYCITFSSSATSSSPYCATPVHRRPNVACPHEPAVKFSSGSTKNSRK